jgi:hypothetical protein
MVITDREWELLEAIDDEIDCGSIKEDCDVVKFVDSLTAEEVEAMRKWVKRNCNYYFDDTNKFDIVFSYLLENIREFIGDINNILGLVKVWQLVRSII